MLYYQKLAQVMYNTPIMFNEKLSAPTVSNGLPGSSRGSVLSLSLHCLKIKTYKANVNSILYIIVNADPVNGLVCQKPGTALCLCG